MKYECQVESFSDKNNVDLCRVGHFGCSFFSKAIRGKIQERIEKSSSHIYLNKAYNRVSGQDLGNCAGKKCGKKHDGFSVRPRAKECIIEHVF